LRLASARTGRVSPAPRDGRHDVMTAGLVLQVVLAGVGVVAALVVPSRWRSLAVGVLAAALGVTGLVTGLAAVAGAEGRLRIGTQVADLTYAPTELGGLFMALVGGVGTLAAVYGIGYAHGAASDHSAVASRTQWSAFVIFLFGLLGVPAAADVVGFLVAWEVMAGASAVLVLADQATSASARSAGTWYAVLTHASFVAVVAGFAVLVAATGTTDLAGIAEATTTGWTADLAFCLLTLGFATKAGLVPLHVWLPKAHPAAPSHASALMSGAMVKAGLYGMVLVVWTLMPTGPRWWALVLIGLGAVSAVGGIVQASVTTHLKRLLAYSTAENLGLMVLALGLAALYRQAGLDAASHVALVACLFLAVGHAAFKTVAFLAAGAVQQATGEHDLDRLGGLARTMPWTAGAFGVAALGAAALPVTGGFVAEWMLLQALLGGGRTDDPVVAVTAPLSLAVIALTAGLALMTFVKAYGIGFLAQPRGHPARGEAHPLMRAAMVVGGLLVVGLGMVPGPLAAWLAGVVDVTGVTATGTAGVDLGPLGAVLNPVALTLLAALVTLPVIGFTAALAERVPRTTEVPAWGCGQIRDSARTQYTATSYAEPLIRVFDDAVQPRRDVRVDHVSESQFMAEQVRYSQSIGDVVEDRVYRPVIALADRMADAARRVQNGSLQRYLGFALAALVVVLVVVS
ncbi:MAG: hydrogenase 4 subunit B, partial [Cellulomonas sp.]|nr:hydrogenase 4 subunit B [Cellulomonas sp.]